MNAPVFLVAALAALVAAWPVWAQRAPATLPEALAAAKTFDPTYRGAVAERTANEANATAARYAYLPELRYTNQQLETESGARTTVSLAQPIFDVTRYYTFQERVPRAQLAESTFGQREHELAQRLLRAVTELVRAREAIRANERRIEQLSGQSQRAQAMFKRDEGTITDVRDTAVRLDQARATQVSLLTRLRVAERQFAAIVGTVPAAGAFAIAGTPRRFALEGLDRYLTTGVDTNPQLDVARLAEQLADIGARRASRSFLPVVSAVATHTETDITKTNFMGITVTMPLQAQTFAQAAAAQAQAERAREQRRDTEEKLKLDIERLRALVESAQQELAIRKDAIGSAELAVEANLKSQLGGVRTSIDVLNAIQTLAEVRNDYASAAATLAENYLSLLLQSAESVPSALEKVQAAVFER